MKQSSPEGGGMWEDLGSVGKRSPGEGALGDNGEGAGEIHPLSRWGGGWGQVQLR